MNSEDPRSRQIFWLRTVFTLVFLGIFLMLVVQPDFRRTLTSQLSTLPPHAIGLLVVLLFVMRIFQTLILRHALSAVYVRLGLWDCFQLLGLKGVYNLGITGGGVAAQLAQAKVTLGIDASRFLAAALLQAMLFISSLLFLFGTILILLQPGPFQHQTTIGMFCTVGAFGIGALAVLGPRQDGRIRRIQALSSLQHLQVNTSLYPLLEAPLNRVYLYSLSLHIARSLRIVILLIVMSVPLPVEFSLAAVLGSDLLAQIPITPAGLGTRELALGYFGETQSLFDVFLTAALIDRGAAVCFNLVHGLVAFFALHTTSPDPRS